MIISHSMVIIHYWIYTVPIKHNSSNHITDIWCFIGIEYQIRINSQMYCFIHKLNDITVLKDDVCIDWSIYYHITLIVVDWKITCHSHTLIG